MKPEQLSWKPRIWLLALSMAFTGFGRPLWAQTITITSAPYNASTTSADNSAAIQAAINALGSGGTVIIPAGNFLSGPLTLQSNMTLQLAAGATLQMTAYDTFPTNTDFLYADNLTNLTINGSGVMDGQGAAWWTAYDNDNSVERPPAMIEITNCTGVTVEGITVQNSPEFHIQFLGTSSNVLASALSITAAWPSPNTDGIDLRGTNINIQNCYISDGDDLVQIGGSQATSGVTVSGCTFGTGHGLSIGSITKGGVSNVLVTNCTFNGTQYGIRLKSDRTDGGPVSNITYSNITMSNIMVNPILFYSYYPTLPSSPATDTGSPVTTTTPFWNNVTFQNVTASEATTSEANTGIIWGLPEAPVSNVSFNACTLTGSEIFEVYNTQGVTFDCNCLINGLTPSNTAAVTTFNISEAGPDDVVFAACNSPTPATNTPTKTNTPTSTFTPTSTHTNTPAPPTNTFTSTATSTATKTNTPTATASSTPTATSTRTDTPVPPTDTLTSTATSTVTRTNTPTATSSNTTTATTTFTPTATASTTATPSLTASPTFTRTDTLTSTSTPTNTDTASTTATPTNNPTQTFTSTVTPSLTATPTSTPSSTASSTSTATGTPTQTSTASSTPSPTITVTLSYTSTATSTATSTTTKTASVTPTDSITPTASTTATPTFTAPASSTATPTATPSSTPTKTSTGTATNTTTPTFTSSNTASSTSTATSSPTFTMTKTSTGTATSSNTSTPTTISTTTSTSTDTLVNTGTPTNTGTDTPIATATFTASSTPSATSTLTSTFTTTATYTASSTPIATTTNTSTATQTPIATLTESATPSNSSTFTPSLTLTVAPSNTPMGFSTFTPSNTIPPAATSTVVVFPNPAKGPGPVTLQVTLASSASQATIAVYTTAFRLVNKITLTDLPDGTTEVALPLTDKSGVPLANGLYYVVVTADGKQFIAKLLILR